MAERPTSIDLRSQSQGSLPHGLPTPRALPSPRFHVAGDVPPELSPLDAFAAQSRLLAKQLEASANGGNRMSRLPPLTIANTLDLAKSGYFNSFSVDNSVAADAANADIPTPTSPPKTELENPDFRPVSVHPHLSGASIPGLALSDFNKGDEELSRGRQPRVQTSDYGTSKEQSPGSIEQYNPPRSRADVSPSYFSYRPNLNTARRRDQNPRSPNRHADTKSAGQVYGTGALAPPRSPFAHKTPSVRSIPIDDSDDDCLLSISTSVVSESQKLSSSSGLSTSPKSPLRRSVPRSPSIASDISAGGSWLSRPTFNFSRPISRASEMQLEMPVRQASMDSQPSFILEDDSVHTPVSIQGDELPESGGNPAGLPSYVYSRYSLPRGKILQRRSRNLQEGLIPSGNNWEMPAIPNANTHSHSHDGSVIPPSPPSRPSTSSNSRPSTDELSSPDPDDHGSYEVPHLTANDTLHSQAPSTTSDSTVRATLQVHSADTTAEDHVEKAIQCHEKGSLSESTYHLRIAARQNHPTGMLLYALACRHGWGMRPNQKEGVQWLRKAADFAILEVADDESLRNGDNSIDALGRKTRKAQFALSIYELGVSHMNGWGIEQDKVLALRCFEIAGGQCYILYKLIMF